MRIGAIVRLVLVLGLLTAFVVWDRAGLHLAERTAAWLQQVDPSMPVLVLAVGAVVYALLLSLPFVPGIELGWAIMAVFGGPGIAAAYLATVAGLNLSFAAGRWIPARWLPARLARFAAEQWNAERDPLIRAAEAAHWGGRLLHGARAVLVAHPLLLLAALFNAPGNFVVGGGGGLGIIAGMTPLPWRWYLLTVVLATAPVPLLIGLGVLQLQWLIGRP